MIVIRKPLQEKQKPEIDYTISKDDKGITLTFKGTVRNYDLNETVTLPFDTYKGKVLQLSLQWTYTCELRISPLYEMTSRYYSASANQNEEYKLCRVSIAPDCKDIVVFLEKATDYICPDAENIVMPKGTLTKTQIIQQYSPFYKERCDYIHKKVTMMKSVDIYNTVAYLESQVDALTRLVLQMTNSQSNAAEILRKADKYSVLDIKDKDKILQEFETDKQNVRNMQKEYYDKD